jgi:hypothetical protein
MKDACLINVLYQEEEQDRECMEENQKLFRFMEDNLWKNKDLNFSI